MLRSGNILGQNPSEILTEGKHDLHDFYNKF